MTAATGADVESICSKCGDVWHVVVAKVGDRIAKVQCKQCHGFHRYKPPPGKGPIKAMKAPPTAVDGTVTKTKTKTKTKGTTRRKSAAPAAPVIAADMSKPVKRYSPAESYTVGERVSHTSFGAGVVEGSPGAGKIQVAFPGGRRILAAAKALSTLERPTNKPDR